MNKSSAKVQKTIEISKKNCTFAHKKVKNNKNDERNLYNSSIGIEQQKLQAQAQQAQMEMQLSQQQEATRQQFENIQLQHRAQMEEMRLAMERQVQLQL